MNLLINSYKSGKTITLLFKKEIKLESG